jgi:hypothetical protein
VIIYPLPDLYLDLSQILKMRHIGVCVRLAGLLGPVLQVGEVVDSHSGIKTFLARASNVLVFRLECGLGP